MADAKVASPWGLAERGTEGERVPDEPAASRAHVGGVKGGLETQEEEGRNDLALTSASAATLPLLLGFVGFSSLTAMAPPVRHNGCFLIRPPIDKAVARVLSPASVPPQFFAGPVGLRAIEPAPC